MTFTYQVPFNDTSRVRFAIGDTAAESAAFTDEEIAALIVETGTWQGAVIACIQNQIARLSVPGFTADWLTVDTTSARKGFETLLALRRKEYGLSSAVSGGVGYVFRPDSNQTDQPDFAADRTEYET